MECEHQGGVDAALLKTVWFWYSTNERFKNTHETSSAISRHHAGYVVWVIKVVSIEFKYWAILNI